MYFVQRRYQVTRELGEGWHGTVYLARDKNTEQLVAMKQQPNTYKSGREAKILNKLHHPNIPAFSTWLQDHESEYIVQEYIPGIDSSKWVDIVGLLHSGPSESILRERFHATCLALSHCHDNGVIHGDIKPSNIIFTDRSASLIDFGCSMIGDRRVRPEGTPLFHSPEKLTWDYGVSSDVWSLGVVLYMWVCGEHPFVKEVPKDIYELRNQIERTELLFTHHHWKKMSPVVIELISMMLQKKECNRICMHDILDHSWFLTLPMRI